MHPTSPTASPAVLHDFDLMPLGVCIFDRDLKVLSWNRTLEEWTGTTRDQIVGKKLTDCYEHLNSPRVQQRLKEVFERRSSIVLSAALHGHFIPVNWLDRRDRMVQKTTVRPLDREGTTAIATMEDVTVMYRQLEQYREAANRLRESEERYQLAVRGSNDGLWDWNLTTNQVFYSQRYRELLGYYEAEFPDVFDSFQRCLHHEDQSRVWENIKAHIDNFVPYDVEARLRTQSGEWRWFRIRGQAIWGDDGEATRMAGSITDVTDRRTDRERMEIMLNEVAGAKAELENQKMELELRNVQLAEASERAAAATLAKSEFLANMSHEIRTPMTAILGFTDLLLTDDTCELSSDWQNALQTIKRNGEYLLEIINDILDLSKIEAGRLTCEKIRVSPRKTLEDVRSLMLVRADAKQIRLDLEFDGPIPETITTDPTRWRQILVNLVGNAIKFTEEGRVRIVAKTEQTETGELKMVVEVIDSGIGMSEEQVARLFRPFTQADMSTTRKFGGTGLGLTISQRFAHMLGGEISVQSEIGLGSNFRVTVSAGHATRIRFEDKPKKVEPRSHLAKTSAPAVPKAHHRILLAEDVPDNQRLLSFILKKANVIVTIVDNGQAAFESIMRNEGAGTPFDLILMDMQMPILDGYSATRKLRDAGFHRPIIALTAHAMSGDRDKCIEAGCTDYFTKPVDAPKLLELLKKYLATSPAASQFAMA